MVLYMIFHRLLLNKPPNFSQRHHALFDKNSFVIYIIYLNIKPDEISSKSIQSCRHPA